MEPSIIPRLLFIPVEAFTSLYLLFVYYAKRGTEWVSCNGRIALRELNHLILDIVIVYLELDKETLLPKCLPQNVKQNRSV